MWHPWKRMQGCGARNGCLCKSVVQEMASWEKKGVVAELAAWKRMQRACDDSHLPVVQAGNLRVFCILRAKKSHSWSGCRGCCCCVEALSTSADQDTWPQPNRGLPAKWVSKPPDEHPTCVGIKASQVLQLETAEPWLRVFDRAPLGCWCGVFHAKVSQQAMRWILILERHSVVRWILILERHSGL